MACAQDLAPGQRVVFVGLAGRADLNGTAGTLTKWDAASGRWLVARGKIETVNVKPANLLRAAEGSDLLRVAEAPTAGKRAVSAVENPATARKEAKTVVSRHVSGSGLTVGQRVNFLGLVGRAELNGKQGTLVKWDPVAGRWAVAFGRGITRETVNVKPDNLSVASPVSGAGKSKGKKVNPQPKSRSVNVKEALLSQITKTIDTKLAVGKRVRFVGLSARADLNGTYGTLVSWLDDVERWVVKREKHPERLNVRAPNPQVAPTSVVNCNSLPLANLNSSTAIA